VRDVVRSPATATPSGATSTGRAARAKSSRGLEQPEACSWWIGTPPPAATPASWPISPRTRDPELRALPSGTSVCGLRIACNSSRRDSDGDFKERPNFFDVSVYGAPGESVCNYMRKGSRVGIDGRLEWREWETADQQKRQAVSVITESLFPPLAIGRAA
jgi:hypothetical protein